MTKEKLSRGSSRRIVRSARVGRRRAISMALLTMALAGTSWTAQAEWPEKVVRLVVPYGPGGSSDVIARLLANEMSKDLGQGVIVENKAGGSGTIAMQEVARAAPDGYTVVLGHVGTLAVNPAMFDKLAYKDQDFAPVALLAKVPMVFAVRADLPVQNLSDFIALAKAQPGKLNYGSAGNGSAGHLAFEMLKVTAGIQVTHIPYKGTGAQLIDLLAGSTDAASAGPAGFMQHAKAGKIRILATGSAERLPSLPDLPTVAELGHPGFDSSQWFGLLVPAKTPADVIARLHSSAAKALTAPAVTRRLEEDGSLASPMNPEEFRGFIASERSRWGDVVRKANLKID